MVQEERVPFWRYPQLQEIEEAINDATVAVLYKREVRKTESKRDTQSQQLSALIWLQLNVSLISLYTITSTYDTWYRWTKQHRSF